MRNLIKLRIYKKFKIKKAGLAAHQRGLHRPARIRPPAYFQVQLPEEPHRLLRRGEDCQDLVPPPPAQAPVVPYPPTVIYFYGTGPYPLHLPFCAGDPDHVGCGSDMSSSGCCASMAPFFAVQLPVFCHCFPFLAVLARLGCRLNVMLRHLALSVFSSPMSTCMSDS